jgi:hypothetical protein
MTVRSSTVEGYVRCTKQLTTSGHHSVMTYSVGKPLGGLNYFIVRVARSPEESKLRSKI